MTFNLQPYWPIFGGSTGGWLRAAEIEEKYAITWTSPKEQIFENADRWCCCYVIWRKLIISS